MHEMHACVLLSAHMSSTQSVRNEGSKIEIAEREALHFEEQKFDWIGDSSTDSKYPMHNC